MLCPPDAPLPPDPPCLEARAGREPSAVRAPAGSPPDPLSDECAEVSAASRESPPDPPDDRWEPPEEWRDVPPLPEEPAEVPTARRGDPEPESLPESPPEAALRAIRAPPSAGADSRPARGAESLCDAAAREAPSDPLADVL
ncbi:hypothetical protein GCM10023074_67740 [Microbispora amethystogenes]|uniref:Uncharacterized protein n=1 Tax=Microbispora amethystogenes TaxID=1427754 RepID=A0ABQ4FNI0_9ACTN|nr:hypothetical protein Mam01_65400 [Microbispora amethystogenes]